MSVNINNSTHGASVPRDIRRFPSELDQVTNRTARQTVAAERKQSYAEAVAAIEGTKDTTRAAGVPIAKSAPTSGKPFSLWEKEGFAFSDLIDMVNPLHHIPIVATIYRNLSGDQIGAAPRVIGGAIWGRIGGFVGALVNAAVEWWSGKDIGDHVYAAVFGDPNNNEGAAIVQKAAPTSNAVSDPAATATLRSNSERVVLSGEPASESPTRSRETISLTPHTDVSGRLASSAHLAVTCYESHRRQGEREISLGIRLPI
jgi:hypothetical protein